MRDRPSYTAKFIRVKGLKVLVRIYVRLGRLRRTFLLLVHFILRCCFGKAGT